jgi:hypothetical protein
MSYPSPERVLAVCLHLLEIQRVDLTTGHADRRQAMVLARNATVAALRHFARLSFPEVAPYFGKPGHQGGPRMQQQFDSLPGIWRHWWFEAVGIMLDSDKFRGVDSE